jgi:hypothetical protein
MEQSLGELCIETAQDRIASAVAMREKLNLTGEIPRHIRLLDKEEVRREIAELRQSLYHKPPAPGPLRKAGTLKADRVAPVGPEAGDKGQIK